MAEYDWVPYLQGKLLTYYQYFALIASILLILLSFFSFVIYLIISKIKSLKNHNYQSIVGDESQYKNNCIHKLQSWFFNGTFVLLSLIPVICSGLTVINLLQGILGMLSLLIIGIFLDNGRKNWLENVKIIHSSSTLKLFITQCLKPSPKLKKRIIIAIISCLLLNCFMYRTCLCFYSMQIGYYNHLLGFGINTYFTRLFQLEKSCPPGPPCQMYTTIPQEPSYAFFLNLHTHTSVDKVVVYYRQLQDQDPNNFRSTTADSFDYLGLQWKTARKVHSALIKNLEPNTKYYTKVQYNGKNWTNAIYKTLPDDPSIPIRMINAGDSGYTEAALNLSKIVSTLSPDIFFMGGDIAYDDNMPACAYTWDSYLTMYGRITQTLGYLLPMVLTVGNHDVGLNQLPGINITVNNYGPAYHIYFPQHYNRNLDNHIIKQVPPLKNRRTILNFTFSNVHYLVLDSGYMHNFDGYQKQWMINSFEANLDKIKFVNYHVPIYSVCENFDRSPKRYLYALFHWVPNFDKYKIMTAFQNHVHSFKRTKPLVGNSPKTNGTVYLGDGAYGAILQAHCKPDVTVDIFETFNKRNNFWLSVIYSDRVQHQAYDSYGVKVDNFTQYVSAYKLQ